VLSRLIWLKVRFTIAVLKVEFRYSLCKLGLHAVSVSDLLARLEEMSRQVTYVSVPGTAGAI
jgi:hypothetical protein